MKKNSLKCCKVVADLALKVTTFNVNSACIFIVHQPKLPKGAEKLRKFK
ncbi:cyclic lactone autoinducer peptide [Alkalibaculum sp. M08DMB]|uniref:Cyclic lactone autoinducer peptide n=1 Tax=Alkalibaculum sporogenes TaxID=2655001 RepID=A0A6A7KAI2_9FIRM|nr:cyclic lactone autoinducer peptide [Alkalibaculum sporogenes]MPW26372.1 cyclic lactone autoinducer peptide [Alkalibaculum sporogenes]